MRDTSRRLARIAVPTFIHPLQSMPYVPTVRLGVEAGRALLGLWFITISLASAQPLYRWLELRQSPPAFALFSALGLALLACIGTGFVGMAGFRAMMHVVSAPPAKERQVGTSNA